MRVVFERYEPRRYRSLVYRDDGVVLVLPGYDRKWRVPHDLAHFATERELRLTDGVWGSIAAGGVFANMQVVAGRKRHDARQRSERVLKANSRSLAIAEVLAGVVHDAVEHRDRRELYQRACGAWGVLHEEPFPFPAHALTAAADTLEELAARWTGRTLEVEWGQPPRAMRRTSRASSS
ncbi:hypothetical protein [Actinophytocola oryzae]|uniref:Uncharacterized protein n=1 Tax=Actinophytocola oryzae TaxID=502181 RepID=A0A4R7VDE5_9PSEU|nr:hypothetical protein [Actinophytocola oryzae]TDV47055.1 hypothetical protein CLV71_110238 [Actinophytocola oryzae]